MQAVQPPDNRIKRGRESIHSGHFMVSTFEAEEQDDEDEVAVPIPEVVETTTTIVPKRFIQGRITNINAIINSQQLSIDTSLSKLFQCMSLAYRQKLTSPKWNRFRGIRLRWKDKIRLNNVIWRCWHLQFIKKENTLICQFASPLDVDTHNKPEAVVLEGKYWKRKLAACTAEYKKWRLFHRNHVLGHSTRDDVEMLNDFNMTWNSPSGENMDMMVDEDYMGLMSDTLFSTITNQSFQFPDTREIAKAGLADFIQPSLGPLQPNLDDYMDTFEPLQEFMACKLPTVPEEQSQGNWPDFYNINQIGLQAAGLADQYQASNIPMESAQMQQQQQSLPKQQSHQQSSHEQQNIAYSPLIQPDTLTPSAYLSVISKNKCQKNATKQQQQQENTIKLNQPLQDDLYEKQMRNVYTNFVNASLQQGSMCNITENLYAVPPAEVQGQYEMHQVGAEQEQSSSSGYKFMAPSLPNLKFTSQVSSAHSMMHPIHDPLSHYTLSSQILPKEEKIDGRLKGAPRGRQRSRSNPRDPPRRPPLISAMSDPSLLNPTNSVLLTQLLSNNTDIDSVFNQRNQNLISSREQHSKQIRIKDENNSPIQILPAPITTTLVITSSSSAGLPAPSTDPLMLNTFSSSNSPVMDMSQNLHSPTSSQGSIGSPNRDTPHRDSRRVGHIHAEQKRRYNIKNGFDMIHTLIPHLNKNPNAKLSKAAMLQKGAEYIRQLRSERNQLSDEMESLKQQIETLNTSISNCQSMLPATGAPVSRRRDTKMQEMFDDYIRSRTMDNWKYWIFSLLFRPLLESFNNFVSTSSLDDLYRSTVCWIEQHCTLGDLRPVVINSLKYLSTKTDILSKPEKLPDEARQIVLSNQKQL